MIALALALALQADAPVKLNTILPPIGLTSIGAEPTMAYQVTIVPNGGIPVTLIGRDGKPLPVVAWAPKENPRPCDRGRVAFQGRKLRKRGVR